MDYILLGKVRLRTKYMVLQCSQLHGGLGGIYGIHKFGGMSDNIDWSCKM